MRVTNGIPLGRTLLLPVVTINYAQAVKVNQATTDNGATPLFMAAQEGYVEIVRVLLEHGALVDTAPTDNSSPLVMAVGEGYPEVVQLLLEHGADATQAFSPGQGPEEMGPHITAMHVAADRGRLDEIQLLAVFGADTIPNTNKEDAANNVGATPRAIATQNGHAAVAKWFGAVEGWSPLQIAAGCRLHRAAAVAIKLEKVDPERGGVTNMLAARVTAASTAPWGVIDHDDAALAVLVHAPVCASTAHLVLAYTSGWAATRHWLHPVSVRAAVHTVLLVAERLYRQAHASASAAAGAGADAAGADAAGADAAGAGAAGTGAAGAGAGTSAYACANAVVDGAEVGAGTGNDAGTGGLPLVQHSVHRTLPTPVAVGGKGVLPEMPPELWLAIALFFLRSDWPVDGGPQHAHLVHSHHSRV
jgi:hypothetical protein